MKKNSSTGVTLLELMVSISISAIVFALVFSAWSYLNKHTLYQESKGTLYRETARIADEITLKLRRTPGLLGFAPSSIELLDSDGSDTLEYAFDGTNLTRNGTPMHFGVVGGGVVSFDVSRADTDVDGSEYLLLEVTISARDRHDHRDTCRFVVNVKGRGGVDLSDQWDQF